MKRPILEINNAGNKYLTVFHYAADRDFTRIIEDAFEYHKISKEESLKISVLILPVKKRATQEGSPTRRDEEINTRARLRTNSQFPKMPLLTPDHIVSFFLKDAR